MFGLRLGHMGLLNGKFPVASLRLDFLAGLNDSRITYSGGTNGTRVNSAGVIVAATTPRFDYSPAVIGSPRGLLVEEARTNLLTYSQEFDNAAWTKVTANSTVTANATTSPDGTANADAVNSLTASGDNRIVNSAIVPNDSATYTATVYVKQNTSAKVRIDFRLLGGSSLNYAYALDFASGVFATVGGNTATSFSATAVGNGWYRVAITGPNNSSGNVSAGISIYGGIDAGNAVAIGSTYVWGSDLQAGSFPTSYIPTTTAAVTRTADSAVMTGANFSSWYNQSEGTFVIQAISPIVGSNFPRFAEPNDGSSNNRISMFTNPSNVARNAVATGGVTQVAMGASVWTAGSAAKMAAAYKANDFALCFAGGAVDTDTSGTVPTVNQLEIGQSYGLDQINTHIQQIQFYPRRLSNEQLQALTV
jgi:hypothetical protein